MSDYTLRAVEGNGTRVTLFGKLPSQANGTIPSDLDQQVAAAVNHAHGATLRGVITVDGVMDQAQITKISADKRVYTVDVTQAIATQRVQAQKAAQRAGTGAQMPVETRPIGPVYWFMENTGIAPK